MIAPVLPTAQVDPAFAVTPLRDGVAQRSLEVQPLLERPYSTVVTFAPHPQEFFSGRRRPLLTPLPEKKVYLQALGVQQLVLLPFDQALAQLTPQQFVEEILIRQLQVRYVSVGQDFCFGQGRSGTTADLQAIAASHGVTVQVVPLYTCAGERISSSAIRQALIQGNLTRANQLLGRPYMLMGEVFQGQQIGRTIGFPTANLGIPPEKFLPRLGVYYVQVSSTAFPDQKPAVMNIGYRPTVEGQQQTVEVHLLDWTGNLYGHTLSVELVEFLRSEQKFPSLDALKTQIQADCDQARSLMAREPIIEPVQPNL